VLSGSGLVLFSGFSGFFLILEDFKRLGEIKANISAFISPNLLIKLSSKKNHENPENKTNPEPDKSD
jgi:hypothetical protein